LALTNQKIHLPGDVENRPISIAPLPALEALRRAERSNYIIGQLSYHKTTSLKDYEHFH
jgi:hypothetical protein